MTTRVRPPHRDATAHPPAALQPLFEALSAWSGAIPLADLAEAVQRVPVTADQLGDAIQIDAGSYVRSLVLDRDNVEVFVMAWLPRQVSPIHDHSGSSCVVRVVAGSARERLYRLLPDGSVTQSADRSWGAGEITWAFDSEIHSLGNAVAAPAPVREILVTIHVYSPPLASTREYAEARVAGA